jgi:hypothetical protein
MKNMLDMHCLTNKAMLKYNLKYDEPISNDFDKGSFFIRIGYSDWWVVGIDENQNIVYAEYDSNVRELDGISTTAIEELELNEYVLMGVQETFIPGMTSTRVIEDPIDDVKSFISSKQVFKLKYIGADLKL